MQKIIQETVVEVTDDNEFDFGQYANDDDSSKDNDFYEEIF